jgi:hypothetical protein
VYYWNELLHVEQRTCMNNNRRPPPTTIDEGHFCNFTHLSHIREARSGLTCAAAVGGRVIVAGGYYSSTCTRKRSGGGGGFLATFPTAMSCTVRGGGLM